MKNNKFLTAILAGALSLTAASCSNEYLDVNENPNSVQAEKITPDLIIPGAISQAHRTQAGTMMQFGNLMMNSWAGNSYSFGGPFAREFNLATVDNTFYTGIWGLYPRIANFAQVEAYPNPINQYDQYIAIAKIMKAYYMQYIVDLYGDVPYSEAFRGQENLTPKYDNDSDIYRNLIQNLEDANALIAAGKGDIPGAQDVVFGGDMDLWTKFSNTLKLRMLIRMSKVTGDLATYRNTKLQSLSSANFINELDGDVTVNPGYNGSNDDSLNPFLLNNLMNASQTTVQNYSLVIVSEHFANAMQGNLILNDPNMTKFNNLGDPRRARLFTNVAGGTYYNGAAYTGLKGIRQGAVPGQPGVPANTNTSKIALGNFVGANVPGSNADIIDFANARGGVLMSLAESQLLQAEAALRYPTIFTYSAQTKFNTGVIASGVWIGVPAATMNSYVAAIVTRPGLGWTGTDAQKIEAIMTQKWIALTNVNPTEMFIEYNRTGLPYTPMATTSQQANKPYRLVYPFSEYAANAANVPNITSAQVFTKNQYTPFWNQN
ncbi:SusD/RagB family nutrient-binding outer membrane lipoprotein [Chryseobacterium sp. Leaf394]|uniref:SusD/RagB family nutrient-binding outer membrane lipoprotein n=1 Tax=Chryseobacterium sp. Leaf394 TaxID=1736361 RepID=UPI0006FA6BE8|nr:SusD/RagB family nutrient-binding outer membrane lipoprotein [Chryseobacterium sp. Leaf394]KQS89208.1 hypothetical protein ASG21_15590 [Chryseobacterium sp. Leaf394]